MNKSYLYFLFVLILLTSYPANINSQSINEEFRSTWVITWHHISPTSSVEQNKARVREILDNHKKANMTSVLFQVRQSGTAYYESSYEPWGYYAGYSHPGYDPLQYAIEEAHKRGLELHAWFNVFSVASTQPGTIASEHPEWICRDQSGNPMTANRAASPGLQAVRDYTINVAMEIVRNYDIDGLHLDYVRWNEYDTDDMLDAPSQVEQESKLDGEFSEKTINKLTSDQLASRFLYDVEHPYSAGVPTGFNTWEDWWRWSVTEFVKTLHDSIQAIKPWVRLTPAALGKYKLGGPNGWNGYYVVYQDAALWFNQGYVDQLTPMHYHWLTGNDLFNHISSDWEPNIQPGITAGRLYSCGPGSYKLDENNVWSNHTGIVERLRDKAWVDGFQFFSYGNWKDYDYWDDAATTFFDRKVKVRDAFNYSQPSPPTISLNKIDSLSYRISVAPDQMQIDNHWYALYRSEDNVLSVNDDQIVDIHFGNISFEFIDSFTGLQDFNKSYKYFATTLNRYWNESIVSNSDSTDIIPSLAPVVISSVPSENGEINISDNIIISFSKTMDSNSFSNSISFQPNVAVNSLSWSSDFKRLTISTSNFLFNTSYTLRIDSLVTDINGRKLDGNNDGVEGDPFILNFSTFEEDNLGPQIVSSYPINDNINIDIGSIISIHFDEAVAPQSLSSSTVQLLKDNSAVSFSLRHTKTAGGESIICIQPNTLFEPNKIYSLKLGSTIADTIGNQMGQETIINFTTSPLSYSEIKMIDNFTNPGDWQQPSYSGSTTGIIATGTRFEYSTSIYPPATSPYKSGKLSYLWDENSGTHMIREYLAGGIPQSTYFDTTYVLQSYVYGDGSKSRFRFCIDEFQGTAWGDHEVSKWMTVDWHGWKLVEWKLNDPSSIGVWIGNGILTGSYFRIDSYQLTKTSDSNISGEIYFDELRAVKKSSGTTGIDQENNSIPTDFVLNQNYPNPFNPSTVISWQSPVGCHQTLKIYDVLGNEVSKLVDEYRPAGNYESEFNAESIDGGLTSGVYFFRLQAGDYITVRKMLLIK